MTGIQLLVLGTLFFVTSAISVVTGSTSVITLPAIHIELECKSLDEAANFLDCEARKHFPESAYALGKLEHERRRLRSRGTRAATV